MKGTEAQLPLSKRLLAAFFAIVLVVGLVPVTAWADSENAQNNDNNAAQQEQTDQSADNGESGDDSADQNSNEAALANESGDGIAVADLYSANPISDTAVKEFNGSIKKSEIYKKLNSTWGQGWGWFSYKVDGKTIDSDSTGNFDVKNAGTSTYKVTSKHGKELGTLKLVEKPTVTSADEFTYDGNAHKPVLKNFKGNELKEGTDYNAVYKRGGEVTEDFTNAGTIDVSITAKNGYTGTFNFSYTINPAEGLTIDQIENVVYDGNSQKQTPTVTDKYGNTLSEGTDYDVTYSEDTTNAGTVTVTVKGKGNYTGEATATYQINPKSYTVTTESAEKVYDGTALTAGGKITGLVNEDDAKLIMTGTQTNVGDSDNDYDIEFSSDQMEDNYEPGGVTVGTLTVNPAKVTVTADAKSKVYGDADPDLTATVSGLVNDESEELITYDVSCKHDEEDAGTYKDAIVPSGRSIQGNYSVTYVPADFTIEKRAIEVSDSATVAYNGQEQVLNITEAKATGLLEGDTLHLENAQVKGTEPGTYTEVTEHKWAVFNDEGNVTKNYDLKVTGELTITKADGSGAAADNGTNSGDKAKTSSASPQTGDSTAPLAAGAAAAAIAAALAAFFVSRKLRGNAKH